MIVPIQRATIIDKKYFFPRKLNSGLKVLIEKGKKVEQDTVLASGEVYEEKTKLDIASEINVKPDEVKKYVTCIHGEQVTRQDVLIHKKRKIINKEILVRAPARGVVDLSEIENGFLKILGPAREKIVHAGLRGSIFSVLRHKMVQIETSVMKVKPFTIIGESIQGELLYLKDQEIKLGEDLHESIIVIDFKIDKNFLRKLALSGVRGVIVGGLHRKFIDQRDELGLGGITICIMHGYGNLSLDVDLVQKLKQNDGYVCLLDARHGELILPNVGEKEEKNGKEQRLLNNLKKGQKVSIFTFGLWGHRGIVDKVVGDFVSLRLDKPFKNRKVEVHINNILSRI